ncbi:MAG: molybdenum cofactor guanylyltransferase [Saprospiraceae bacterium]|nr:molybdenum cofactor guanylyltransferase [Saprospiraceae bacterium]
MKSIILCGGQSSRMGADKAMVVWRGKSMVSYSMALLQGFPFECGLSVNPVQFPIYQSMFPNLTILPDEPGSIYQGPLKGMLSASRKYPDENILFIACDLPLIKPELVHRLIETYQSNKGYEVYLFSKDGEYEPLLGIYSSLALKNLDRPSAVPPRSGLRHLLRKLKVYSLDLSAEERDQFKNFNTAEDLRGE